MSKNYLVLGKWNAICDKCGRKKKMSELRKEWTGLMVCEEDWETRHPQDLIRVPIDDPHVPWARPEPDDVFLGNICTVFTSQGVAGYGTAGCSRAGLDFHTGNFDEWNNYFEEDINNAIAGIAIAGLAVSGTVFSLSPTS